MAGKRLFKVELTDMTLEGWRDFDAAVADCPYVLKVDSNKWNMTLADADWLGRGARQLEWRIRWAREKGERPAAYRIRKKISHGASPEESAVIELGIAANEETDAVYFEFDGRRVTLSHADGTTLLADFGLFCNDVADVRKATD